MPNPRYISADGSPTQELLERLRTAKQVIGSNIGWFCEKYVQDPREMGRTDRVYVIGSHANPDGWNNETSDLDLKILNSSEEITPSYLQDFKREILKPLLCQGEKRRWIDIYFVQREDQVLLPRFDVTEAWNLIDMSK